MKKKHKQMEFSNPGMRKLLEKKMHQERATAVKTQKK